MGNHSKSNKSEKGQPVVQTVAGTSSDKGANPNSVNSDGNNLIHLAIMHGDLTDLRSAITLGADVNHKNRYGHTPLGYYVRATKKPNWEVVKLLVDVGADRNTCNGDGNNLVHLAIMHGSLTDLRSAIALDVDVNHKNRYSHTPLGYYLRATKKPNWEKVKLLVDAGADRNTCGSDGNNLVHTAIMHGNLTDVRTAIALGANVNHKNTYGHTPLEYYMRNTSTPNHAVVNLLVNRTTATCNEPTSSCNEIPIPSALSTASSSVSPTLQPQDSAATICNHLVTYILPKQQLVNLAKRRNMKERVLAQIQSLPTGEERSDLIDQALNPATQLGQFFAVRRGWLPTSTKRGTLATLLAMQSEQRPEPVSSEIYASSGYLQTASAPPLYHVAGEDPSKEEQYFGVSSSYAVISNSLPVNTTSNNSVQEAIDYFESTQMNMPVVPAHVPQAEHSSNQTSNEQKTENPESCGLGL